MTTQQQHDRFRQFALIERIADALERMAPQRPAQADFTSAEAFVWHPAPGGFQPVPDVNRAPLELLRAIAPMRDRLLENTMRFARGLPANNALLWGARGMGKSSLVKAVHARASEQLAGEGVALKLVEIHREDISTLPECLNAMRVDANRFIVFCDDLSFDDGDTSYKSLKAVLEGGIEGRPDNVIFYATSNRRHLLPRDMAENERSSAINPGETAEEKVSLSDRFGLWIGFHHCSQGDFLEMVRGYAEHYRLPIAPDVLELRAKEWAMMRGARSGRVAWQFIQDLAGELQIALNDVR
jgi:uncharacterized protein